jgi:hypothetical protein
VASITFPAADWPSGVSIARLANPKPTAELPYRELSILRNTSAEPFYVAVAVASPTPAERLGSGLAPGLQPFFKLVSDAVFEWRQNPRRQVGTNPANGVPVYGFEWVKVTDETFLVRQVEGGTGLTLIADRFAYLESGGAGTDCDAGEVRPVVLSAASRGKPMQIAGSLSFEALP